MKFLSNIIPAGLSRFFDEISQRNEEEKILAQQKQDFLSGREEQRHLISAYVDLKALALVREEPESFGFLAKAYCSDCTLLHPYGKAFDLKNTTGIELEQLNDFMASLSDDDKYVLDKMVEGKLALNFNQFQTSVMGRIMHMS
jgi:hypothetical protein